MAFDLNLYDVKGWVLMSTAWDSWLMTAMSSRTTEANVFQLNWSEMYFKDEWTPCLWVNRKEDEISCL